jgi:hypothetical protein
LIVIGVVLALAIAAVAVALVGGDDVSPTAVRVDGTRTTSATLDPELDGFSQGDYFADVYRQQGLQFSGGPGSLSARGTAQWLAFRTQSQLAQQLLERRGSPLTDQAVDEAEKNLADQGITAGMSGAAVEQLARFSASAEALIADAGGYDQYRAAMRRAARAATVDVDPKYARWNQARLAFCVPTGCRSGGQSVVPPAQGTGG